MDIPLLPFIKSSRKVKRYGGTVKSTAPFSSETSNVHGNAKAWRTTTSHGVQDLPPPAQLLRKSSNSSGRKRSREISGIEQHLAQLKRKQIEITSDNSELPSSIDMLLSENSILSQEVPSSPVLKKARNSFSDLDPPFYTEAEHNHTYQVSIDHDWEEAPVDVSVPKVTVKRIRKSNFTGVTPTHQENLFQGENHFLQLHPAVKQLEIMNSTFNRSQCDDDPCSTNAMLNILPHEE